MYHKIFPAELDSLYEMLTFIKEYAHSHHVPSSTLDQIILATEEALVNIMSYGYPGEKKGVIEISCEQAGNPPGIRIKIKDQGVPFNPIENAPTSLPPPSAVLAKAEDSLGGYGIYLFIGLMDCVEYQRTEEGNVLLLTKYFN